MVTGKVTKVEALRFDIRHAVSSSADTDNEDRFVTSTTLLAVIDGASVAAQQTDAPVDALVLQQFLYKTTASVYEYMASDGQHSAGELLRVVSEDMQNWWTTTPGIQAGTRFNPSASIALASITDNTLEVSSLGDVGVWVIRNGEVAHAVDNKSVRIVEAYNLPSLDRVWDRIAERRRHMNSTDTYWIFGVDARASAHARCSTITLQNDDIVVGASDGITRLWEIFDCDKDKTLIEISTAETVQPFLDHLRKLEQSQTPKIPTTKTHDDATLLVAKIVYET